MHSAFVAGPSRAHTHRINTSPSLPPPLLYHAEYRLIGKKGEGTFSEVLKAQSIKSGKFTAIKCMKNHFESIDQVHSTHK